MSGRDIASLEDGAGARAADGNVDALSEVIRSLDNTGQGEFTMRLLLAAKSKEQLHDTIPSVHRLFVDARAQVMEKSLGNLSAFYTMFPGNGKFKQLFRCGSPRTITRGWHPSMRPASAIRTSRILTTNT